MITAVIVIAMFMGGMKASCEGASYMQSLITKSPIVMVKVGNFSMITDTRDSQISHDLESLNGSKIVELIKNILRPGDKVLEVSAGIGQYSLIFGDAIGPNGKLFIFEPNDNSLLLLSSNLKINDLWSRALVINKMPYNNNSTVTLEKYPDSVQRYRVLYKKENHSSDEKNIIDIRSVKIDTALGAKPLNFIKLNCYGTELQVLSGAEKTLQNSPNISILTPWSPKLMGVYNDVPSFVNNMVHAGFEFWSISVDGSKELITKNRLTKESFDNMLITRNII